MRKLQNQYLNDDFYKEVVEPEYNIDVEETRKIVAAEFAYLKEQMEQPNLPTVRLKYFGTFMVTDKRADTILRRTEKQLVKGTITPPVYEKRKNLLESFIKSRKESK